MKGKTMAGELAKPELVRACLKRSDGLTYFHESQDDSPETPVLCLAFIADRRYIEHGDVELRLGISFGANPFLPKAVQCLVGLPVGPAKFRFGIHGIVTKGNQATLHGGWYGVHAADECETGERALEVAKAMLTGLSDNHYERLLKSIFFCPGMVAMSYEIAADPRG